MKTKNEILKKHLSIMLNRTKESFVSIEEMQAHPEYQACINAMQEYADQQKPVPSKIPSDEIVNKIAKLHYADKPNAKPDKAYRLVRAKTLKHQIETVLELYQPTNQPKKKRT